MFEPVLLRPSFSPISKRKSSDQTVISSTVLVDDTELKFDVTPGSTWAVELVLNVTCSAAGQIRVAIDGPSMSSILVDATLEGNALSIFRGTAAALATAIQLNSVTGTTMQVRVNATFVVGATAGTVKLQFTQNVSDLTATAVKAGSSLVATRIA